MSVTTGGNEKWVFHVQERVEMEYEVDKSKRLLDRLAKLRSSAPIRPLRFLQLSNAHMKYN